MITEAELRAALVAPAQLVADDTTARAAVAAVARQRGDDVELLFIERAKKEGDRWSGQMAFPGGRAELSDADSNSTAERETSEEIDLDITGAERIGRLDDIAGGGPGRSIIVSIHVYWIGYADPELTPNYEVADTVWVPSRVLLDAASYEDFRWHLVPDQTYPSVRVGPAGKVIWGLTFRMLEDLFDRMGRPFPGIATR